MNAILGKAIFNSLRILLDYEASSSIIPGKHTQKFQKEISKIVHWSTK